MSRTSDEPLRLAFAGFRHGHILSLYKAARENPRVRIVGGCEEDAATRDTLHRQNEVLLTHDDLGSMLAAVPCDVIAVGDYFGRRGALVLQALQAGKHVICDKPICTKLSELAQIEAAAQQMDRRVGCLLDLRASAAFRTMRRLLAEGTIGQVQTVMVTAPHPLLFGKRADWYFQPGKHGGTLNDIAVHAMDLIPWLTGRALVQVVRARAWNARLPEYPHFQDSAQFMLMLEGGGGALGDVSYLAPDGCGYTAPQYWRITCHGTHGVMETADGAKTISLARGTDKAISDIGLDELTPNGPLDWFLKDLAGDGDEQTLNTAAVFAAARRALVLQDAADRQLHDVSLEVQRPAEAN